MQTDAGGKFIRKYDVKDGSIHDSQVFESLLDERNSSREVFADSAYRSKEKESSLKAKGFRPRLQHKGCRNKPLSEREIQGNRTRAKIRSRIEHVFGIQTRRAGNLIIRTIGIARAKVKIGLRNLAYNLDPLCLLYGSPVHRRTPGGTKQVKVSEIPSQQQGFGGLNGISNSKKS